MQQHYCPHPDKLIFDGRKHFPEFVSANNLGSESGDRAVASPMMYGGFPRKTEWAFAKFGGTFSIIEHLAREWFDITICRLRKLSRDSAPPISRGVCLAPCSPVESRRVPEPLLQSTYLTGAFFLLFLSLLMCTGSPVIIIKRFGPS